MDERTESFWVLHDVNLFEVMCPHKVGGFAKENHFRSYKKGETIYFNEDQANTLYLIANGKVRLVNYTEGGQEVIRHILGRGEVFGELAILGESQRDEVAEAMEEDTMICPVKVEEINDLMKDNKEFAFKIHKLIGLRIKKLQRRVESLVFKDVKQRLAEFILDLEKDALQTDARGQSFQNPLTHKDVASLIGTSRQTVTTLLNEWRECGIVQFDRKNFQILKPKELHYSK
jgi:CRP/FNR family transcriptional regulator, cyclic AMP receptor protein